MKKNILLLIIVMTVTVFAGCKNNNQAYVSPPVEHTDKNNVEITVITSYGGDDGNRQNYERAYTAYEETTGNIVKDMSGISNEEWKTQIMTQFDNGREPDVLFYFTGADSNKIVEEGKVVSIDEIRSVYPDYASNMDDGMLAKSPIDGKNYAVPVNGYWEGLYVNKKVLAACRVKVPDVNTTWEQFLNDCRKIADKGYTPIAASLHEVPHYWFEFCVFNNGTIESHPNLPETYSDAIGKNWAAGLKDIKDLYERGFFPENTTTDNNVKTDALIIENKAAFMIDGSWKMGWFSENASDINDFTVTYVPGKGERKSTDIVGGISMGYFITKKAWDNPEKQEACIEFVKAMTTNEVVATFGVTAVTALKNDITLPAGANNFIKDALEMNNNATSIVAAAADGLSPDTRKDLFNNVKNVITGDMSAEESLRRCFATND